MRILIYVFLGIFSINTLQVSAQIRIGGLEEPHRSAVLDLNETGTMNDGNRGLALPRVKLSPNTTLLNGTTPSKGMMVYNTSTFMEQGVYYYADNKWIKISDGAVLEGDAIVGNEVTDATQGGGLIRDGAGAVDDPYTLRINKEGVTSEMIAENAVTGDKIESASDKSVLQYNGNEWAPAQAEDVLKAATAAGLKISRIQFKNGSYSATTQMMVKFDKEIKPDRTLFLVNGYYYDSTSGSKGYAPLFIVNYTKDAIFFPGTDKGTTAQYSMVVVEFE